MITCKNMNWHRTVFGILFTCILAIVGYLLAQLPLFNRFGPLAMAILVAIAYRQFRGYPTRLESGITFSSKYLLRFAIILYGLKLNIQVILDDGIGLLLKSIVAISLSVILMYALSKWCKLNRSLSFLLGVGTGICGAAAIAAVAPIVKAKSDDTAISIAIIALTGTVFSIGYTLLLPILPLESLSFGAWSGLSLHELAHVALAAEPAGEDALAFALLAKLSRVLLLVPFCFIVIFWLKCKETTNKNEKTTIPFPYFLIGFALMSIVGTYVLGPVIPFPDGVATFINEATTFLLTTAMVGLGLNVSLAAIRQKALYPFFAMLLVSVILAVTMYFIV